MVVLIKVMVYLSKRCRILTILSHYYKYGMLSV